MGSQVAGCLEHYIPNMIQSIVFHWNLHTVDKTGSEICHSIHQPREIHGQPEFWACCSTFTFMEIMELLGYAFWRSIIHAPKIRLLLQPAADYRHVTSLSLTLWALWVTWGFSSYCKDTLEPEKLAVRLSVLIKKLSKLNDEVSWWLLWNKTKVSLFFF